MADERPPIQFRQLKDHDRIAFGAYVALHDGKEQIMLGAPSLDALEREWNSRYPESPLDRERAQRVLIVAAPKK